MAPRHPATALAAAMLALLLAAPPMPAEAGGYQMPVGRRWFLNDYLKTTGVVLLSDGTPESETVFKPFGGVHQQVGSDPNSTIFAGHHLEKNTGLYYMNARWQNPETGTFVSVDPLIVPSDPQSASGYAYARNNPVSNTDPTGTESLFLFGSWRDRAERIARAAEHGRAEAFDQLIAEVQAATGVQVVEGYAGKTPPLTPGQAIDGVLTAGDVVNGGLDGQAATAGSTSPTGEGADTSPPSATRGADPANPNASATSPSSSSSRATSSRRPTAAQRREVKARATDESGTTRCEYCGQPTQDAAGSSNSFEVDHIDPVAQGGKTESGNLAASCRTCNRGKGAKTPEEAGLDRPR